MNTNDKKYQGVIPPDHITNILGPIGESIVSRPIYWTLSKERQEEILLRVQEKLIHLLSYKDDRILAIHGALLVENTIDSHLADFIPGYKTLLENSDFTFSMKIDLSKAIALMPVRIFESSHIIRKTRNDFAHNLEIISFENVPKRIQAARQKLNVTTGLPPCHFHRYRILPLTFLLFLPLNYFNCIFFEFGSYSSFFGMTPSALPPMCAEHTDRLSLDLKNKVQSKSRLDIS